MLDIGQELEDLRSGAEALLEEANELINTAQEDGVSAAAQQAYDDAMAELEIARAERDDLDARINALSSYKSFLEQYKSDVGSIRSDINEATFISDGQDHFGTGYGTYMQSIYDEFTDNYDPDMLYYKIDSYWDDICTLKSQVSSLLTELYVNRRLYDDLHWLTTLGVIYL